MGQKVHPFVQRLGIIRSWQSHWFVNPQDYPRFIEEDFKIRKTIFAKFKQAAVSKVIIERLAGKIVIKIFSARPGIIIGRQGSDIEKLREEINEMAQKEISISIEEVKEPGLDAQLVAFNIISQIEKRIAFRRAVKKALEQIMMRGAKGAKICAAGRLDGAEMCRVETYKQGKVPLQTLRADIDYGWAEAFTTYGVVGVKVWIFKGEILQQKINKVSPVELNAAEQAPA